MTEAEWLGCEDPKPMLLAIMDSGSGRKLRLFAVACCTAGSPTASPRRNNGKRRTG